ncbi:kinase-like domain-containing protein [Tribonema minus]|uniref:Kinase-like domain-containing protein n=1 Tax=Tribonema minus TaxID=303371 RepID=A0A835Z9A0_9STRA|nr:kinase-like domain-containing protein [Tribonema minus]
MALQQWESVPEERPRSDRGLREVSYQILGHVFTVESRYRDLKAVGKGSYGIVCSALDLRTEKRVAIKKITPMAQQAVDAKHVLREIRLMRYLGVHPNIISLEDVAVREFDDELYIVMELLDSDLHRIIQSAQPLSDAHHRYFMYQLLRGVKFLHDNRIIHRDLKPGNLLVTKSCQLRITDFGLARERPLGRGAGPDEEVDDPMTEHVVTRWYRPPELMLCPDGLYTYAVDLWSVGCIFAELLGRAPLFPGTNFVDQLTLIFDVVGSPSQHEVAHIRNNQARRFLDSMAGKDKQPYAALFPQASEQAIDLLEHLLVFDPPKRLSVADALDHPYFDALRTTEGLREDPPVAVGLEFDFESQPMARLQLKQLILQEVSTCYLLCRTLMLKLCASVPQAPHPARGECATCRVQC